MDTTDPEIYFDGEGVCKHCHEFDARLANVTELRSRPEKYLYPLIERIKKEGRRKPYDCVLGVSGGVDSTYAAYIAKDLGLRPLAVHLDNGWNSTEAVTNIQNCLNKLDIDLYTEVLDWELFRDIQLAFLKASTPDSEIPTDHAIGGLLLKQAAKNKVRFIIAGQNIDTEGMGVRTWSTGYHDWRYIKSVHRQFGKLPIKSFLHYSVLEHAYYKLFKRISRIDILNYVPFNKNEVKEFIAKNLGWVDYGGKHHESIYTRFFQSFILPEKFGYDKRLFHLSPLVAGGLLSREDALKELDRPPCSPDQMEEDLQYVLKKLQLTRDEFDKIMDAPRKTIYDYPSYERSRIYNMGLGVFKKIIRS